MIVDASRPSVGANGFTLVELLVSLTIFALISLAGISLVQTVIDVQERTETRGGRLADIQRALYLVSADFEQMSFGPYFADEGIQLVRGSATGSFAVTYRFDGNSLQRQTGDSDVTVLDGISGMRIRFLKQGVWTDSPYTDEDPTRPVAIELAFNLAPRLNETSGQVRRIIELPAVLP